MLTLQRRLAITDLDGFLEDSNLPGEVIVLQLQALDVRLDLGVGLLVQLPRLHQLLLQLPHKHRLLLQSH